MTKLGTPRPITATPWPTSSPSLPGPERPEQAEADADQQPEREREDAELERHRQRLADQVRDRLLGRASETPRLPLRIAAQPGEELLDGRLAEAVVVGERGVLRRAEHARLDAHRRGDRVPRQQPQNDEDDDRDAEQRHDRAG